MKTFADRIASPALRLLAWANLAFFTLFVVALLAATDAARAQEAAACEGRNLLDQMARDEPERLERLRALAAETENGDALLWRVEGADAGPSWLFGTMHMTDPRVLALPDPVEDAFEAARSVAIETTDITDQGAIFAIMAERPELLMFTDEATLFGLFDEEDRRTVEDALRARGVPPASVQKMKPWMLAAMLALPACEMARQTGGEPVLDKRLAADAEAQGKALGGLERAVDQLEAMASIPMEFHLLGLIETLRIGDRIDDVMETMIAIYLSGETGLFLPFFRETFPAQDEDSPGYAEFEELMINARNRTMADNSLPFIEEGAAFIAVGALHLPGAEGLVELLRAEGYEVTAVR